MFYDLCDAIRTPIFVVGSGFKGMEQELDAQYANNWSGLLAWSAETWPAIACVKPTLLWDVSDHHPSLSEAATIVGRSRINVVHNIYFNCIIYFGLGQNKKAPELGISAKSVAWSSICIPSLHVLEKLMPLW
jgi:hypothetical protein